MIKLPVDMECGLCCCIKKEAVEHTCPVGKASCAHCWVLQGISVVSDAHTGASSNVFTCPYCRKVRGAAGLDLVFKNTGNPKLEKVPQPCSGFALKPRVCC